MTWTLGGLCGIGNNWCKWMKYLPCDLSPLINSTTKAIISVNTYQNELLRSHLVLVDSSSQRICDIRVR